MTTRSTAASTPTTPSPFFTGLSTLIAGAAVLLVALALLASARGGGGPSDNLRGVLAFLGITAGVLMLIVCGTNLVSYLRKDDAVPVDIDWGLIVVWIGALASAAIIPAAFNQGSGDRV